MAHIDLRGAVIRMLTLLWGDLYRITFCENLTALVISYLSRLNSGEFSNPVMVGRFFGSMSRQLEIRSRIRPNSFLRSRTSALAKDWNTFLRVSAFECDYPGNLGAC